MSYVDGFVIPIAEDKVEAYRLMAEQAGKIWKEHGALEYKECLLEDAEPKSADDMTGPGFTLFTEIAGANKGETVIFAFIIYKSRKHRDEVNAKVMNDPRIRESCDENNMPFDWKRMAYGGFKTIVEY